MAEAEKRLVSISKVAEYLDVSRRTVERLMREREHPIPFRRVGASPKFDLEEVMEWTKPESRPALGPSTPGPAPRRRRMPII